MTSHPGKQTITYCPIPRKSNQAMKFGLVIEDNKINTSLHAENEPGILIPDLLLFFKKALCDVKASGLQLSFNILIALSLA